LMLQHRKGVALGWDDLSIGVNLSREKRDITKMLRKKTGNPRTRSPTTAQQKTKKKIIGRAVQRGVKVTIQNGSGRKNNKDLGGFTGGVWVKRVEG